MARLRAYLVRTTYEWLVEHDLTPYLLVDAEQEGVEVPREYVENGKIVLNASPIAVRNMQLDNDFVGFEASFSGYSQQLFMPVSAVLAVYARETGQGVYAREEGHGMLVNEGETDGDLDPHGDKKPTKKGTGGLRIVK